MKPDSACVNLFFLFEKEQQTIERSSILKFRCADMCVSTHLKSIEFFWNSL